MTEKLRKNIIFVIVLLAIIGLSVGFSAFQKQLFINDTKLNVRLQEDVRVSNIYVSKTSGNAISNLEDFNINRLYGNITLPETNSYVLYKVDLSNYGNVKSGLLNIVNNESGTNYSICDANGNNCTNDVKTPICNGSNCTLGTTKEMYIKLTSNTTGSKNVDLTFDFEPYNTITYTYFDENTSSFQSEIMSHDTYLVTFTSKPEQVDISGTVTYTYNKNTGVLCITDVNSDINIHAKYLLNDVAETSYSGSDPDNYVRFNNTLYRIITKENIDDGSGNTELRTKITKESSIGNYIFDATLNYFEYANIYTGLNGDFYDTLDNTSKDLIDDALWLYDTSTDGSSGGPKGVKSTGNKYSAKKMFVSVTSGTTTYYYSLAKIALINKDDYTNNSSWLKNDQFTINPYNDSGSSGGGPKGLNSNNNYFKITPYYGYSKDKSIIKKVLRTNLKVYSIINEELDSTLIDEEMPTYPTMYLVTDALITSGNGTRSNPYLLEKSSEGLRSNPTVITGRELTMNSSAQELVTVTNKVGTVYYSLDTVLDATNYTDGSTSIPTRTATGSYRIYYYIPEGNGYKQKSGMVNTAINGLKFTINYSIGANVQSIEKNNSQCITDGTALSCEVILPQITVNNGGTIVGWSPINGDTTGVMPNQTYVLNSSNSGSTLYANATLEHNYQNTTTLAYYQTLNAAFNMVQSNETIKVLENTSESDTARLASSLSNIELDLNGKTITMTNNTSINVFCSADIYNSSNTDATINGRINVSNSNGNLTINSASNNKVIVKSNSNSTIEVSNGSFTMYDNVEILNTNSEGRGILATTNVNILGGKILSGNDGILLDHNAILTIGTNDGNISTANPIIESTYHSAIEIDYNQNYTTTIYYYDGILKSSNLSNRFDPITPSGYAVNTTRENSIDTSTLAEANYYNTNSEKYYMTLSKAFNLSLSGQTIKVLKNTSESVYASVDSLKTISLDLNGKTITGNEHFNIANSGILKIDNSSVNEGKIIGSFEYVIYTYNSSGVTSINSINTNKVTIKNTVDSSKTMYITTGTLNLYSNVYIENSTSDSYGINNYNGIVNIEGANIIGTNGIMNGNVVNFKSGTINVTSTGIYNNSGTITLGVNDEVVSTTSPEIKTSVSTNAIYGIYSPSNNNNTLYFYDGIVMKIGGLPILGASIVPAGYEVYEDVVDGYHRRYLVKPGILMNGSIGSETTNFLRTNIQRQNIEKIIFTNSISGHTANGSDCFDVSRDQDGTVLAWVSDTDSNNLYEITIGGTGLIYINNGFHLFANLINVTIINGLEYIDTSNVTNMRNMFNNCQCLSSLDLSNFDTSKVVDMAYMFYGCANIGLLDVSSFDTSKVSNMDHLFADCASINSLELSNFNTSNVTDMDLMFSGCVSITSLDLSSFDTSKVTTINGMFSNCEKIISLDLSSFNTSLVTNMGGIFRNCNSLNNLDLSSFDTSKVTNMSNMFSSCKSLKTLNLRNFDTSQVIDMSSMFFGCILLKSLDLSNFNTINVTTMGFMFGGFGTSLDKKMQLEHIYGLENFDTSNVTNMQAMFSHCGYLKELNLSSFNTSNVTNMSNMFCGITSDDGELISLDLSGFDTSKVTNMSSMFAASNRIITIYVSDLFVTDLVVNSSEMFWQCVSVIGGAGTAFSSSNSDGITYAHIDGGVNNPGYFTGKGGVLAQGNSGTTTFFNSSPINKNEVETVTFQPYMEVPSGSLGSWDASYNQNNSVIAYYTDTDSDNLYEVTIASNGIIYAPTTCAYMFAEFTNLEAINNLKYLDTSNANSTYRMFIRCSKLTSLDFSNFNTSKVTNMNAMFNGCSSLLSLDLSNFDTSHVSNMALMFSGCLNVLTININSFNTSNVTNMKELFNFCKSLTSLDLSSFNTSNVTDMSNMFEYCNSLTSLDVSNFDTSNVTTMASMFDHCISLTSLDVSNFDTSNVTNMNSMFRELNNITSLNIGTLNTSIVENMFYMFYRCEKISSLDLSSFDTSNVTNMAHMFDSCFLLVTINVSDKFVTTAVTNSTSMFYNCTNLVGGAGTTYNSSYIDATYAHIDGGQSNPGYFTGVNDIKAVFHYNSSNTLGEFTPAIIVTGCTPSNGSCLVVVPPAVSGSVGTYNSSYFGVSTTTNSMTTSSLIIDEYTHFYAVYQDTITNYYYNSGGYATRNLYKNEMFSSNVNMNSILGNSTTSNENYEAPTSGPNDSVFVGYSNSNDTTVEYNNINEVLSSSSNTLYDVYSYSITYKKGSHVNLIGANSGSCNVIYNSTSCGVILPTIIPFFGYKSVGWSLTSGDTTGTAALSVYMLSSNDIELYANAIKGETLYSTFETLAEDGTYVHEYTGEHKDSFNIPASKKIYHFYAANNTQGNEVLTMNNVKFAGHCWQMIRTTDTGGVKMIYNGEYDETNKCNTSRGNHVGYSEKTLQSLSASYYYGTDYTYNGTVFSLSGTVTNGSIKLGQYTCKKTTATGTCSTLYLVDKYSSEGEYYTMSIAKSVKYHQIGEVMYNTEGLDGSVGYKYGKLYNKKWYPLKSYNYKKSTNLYNSSSYYGVRDNVYFSDSFTYDSNTNTYTLTNPFKSIHTTDLVGKYTLLKTTGSASGNTLYYALKFSSAYNLLGSDPVGMTPLLMSNGETLSKYSPMLMGTSLTDNGNDTYTVNNIENVDILTYFTNYADYNNKYMCEPGVSTCVQPMYILNTTERSYDYYYPKDKILLGKTRTNLNLNDTITVTFYDLYTNSSNYSTYKYTCGDLSSSCTNTNIKYIKSYANTQFYYYENNYYGSGFTWDGSKYTLTGVLEMEARIGTSTLYTHRYMCKEVGTTECEYITYMYNNNDESTYNKGLGIIDIYDGKGIEDVVNEMFRTSTYDSSIKLAIDLWYKKYMLSYDNLIEDTIYCNDRYITNLGEYNPIGSLNSHLTFNNYSGGTNLNCRNITDQLSVSNNSAKLDYKVGLITSPELYLLNAKVLRKTSTKYWTLSPSYLSVMVFVDTDGSIGKHGSNGTIGVRPVISLRPGTVYQSGTGSVSDPYVIE